MSSLALISSVPAFISREEHAAIVSKTPESFADISPVLCHKEENVRVTLDPPLEGFSTEDAGTLYVLESVLVFVSTAGSGFQIEYPAITLHAVSRSDAGPSIYCQLEGQGGDPSDDEVENMRELSILPQTADSLEPIFDALSRCAALHPDPHMSDDEDDAIVDSDHGFQVFTGDEEQELSQVGRAALEYLESIIVYPETNGARRPSRTECRFLTLDLLFPLTSACARIRSSFGCL
ncbi:hypothetical protein MIND_01319400 [Mycena indigotica]|uniref:Regulator of volume decrease after cellular swelling-domain-containing protein n=1 Tax=Mycena indigotica TaxID=2126181 RepID=A0A8H6S3S6_9AGAR|nr:uncharacterized protein MIND_01319400 [Mycena indigotica]KAF7290785.1 hypothetical protein MIND_01319400 [Mycena indigotica]